MAKFTVETRSGTKKEIAGRNGVPLMKLIRRAGIEELVAQCGGTCSCATCHVYLTVLPPGAFVPPAGPSENMMLANATDRTFTSRLSCQVRFDDDLDGMHVTIAPENLNSF
jgi:2Fe-2S ferredoxin